MSDPIMSAYDPKREKLVRIGAAVAGERYKGIHGSYHQDCILYPVRRKYKLDSFVHLPEEAYCPDGRGESSQHREAKLSWVEYIEDQLSGCSICSFDGRSKYPNHPCPATYANGRVAPSMPSCHGILWFCESCSQPHLYKILRHASTVRSEWWTPGRTARVDIALLGDSGNPTAFIEVKRRYLSERPFKYAGEHKIPLFVLDVSLGENIQPQLHNNWQQEGLVRMPDLSVFPPRRFDFLNYSIQGMNLACGTDNEGHLEWRISYTDPDTGIYQLPQPSLGPFILASKSTVRCEDLKSELLGHTFSTDPEAAEPPGDWFDW